MIFFLILMNSSRLFTFILIFVFKKKKNVFFNLDTLSFKIYYHYLNILTITLILHCYEVTGSGGRAPRGPAGFKIFNWTKINQAVETSDFIKYL